MDKWTNGENVNVLTDRAGRESIVARPERASLVIANVEERRRFSSFGSHAEE